MDKNEHLVHTLEKAKFTVTYSSNSGVISLLKGIPTIAMDKGSMIYDHVNNSLDDDLYRMSDRSQWCREISYTQWKPRELRDGSAWQHLKQGLKN